MDAGSFTGQGDPKTFRMTESAVMKATIRILGPH